MVPNNKATEGAIDAKAQGRQLLWMLVSGILVWFTLRISASEDLLSTLTKPIILGIVRAAGFSASDMGSHLEVGALNVPWTGDCSGASILSVILATILWSQRTRRLDINLILRLGFALPLAYMCNIARILSLLCYRATFYPAVETPSIHYFVGFLWVLPAIPILLRDSGTKGNSPSLTGMIHLCACLAIVAPMIDEPGGWLIAASSLILLIPNFESTRRMKHHLQFETYLWFAVALWVFFSRMESLWLPWLLINPWTYSFTDWRKWTIFPIALGTMPIIAMRAEAQVAISLLLIFQLCLLLRRPENETPHLRYSFTNGHCLYLIPLFCLPLLAPKLSWAQHTNVSPPTSIQSTEVGHAAFQIKLLGQPAALTTYWFAPRGDGRHHNLRQCLLFRGVTIIESDVPDVWTDGQHWMVESFLVNGQPLRNYESYLLKTFLPFSPSGVHLVFVCDQQSMPNDYFKEYTDSLVLRLTNLLKDR